MKVRGLDGRQHNLPLSADERNVDKQCSAYHVRARAVLARIYPNDRTHEEVQLPGCQGQKLFLDFFLPLRRLAVEVQGEQHTKFIPHFHGTMAGFLASLKRDRVKRQWCEMNEMVFVTLPHTEGDDEWTERIRRATAGEDLR